MSGAPGPQDFHVWQQRAAGYEKQWRKAVSKGDRKKAVELQKQMDRATKRSILFGKKHKKK